MGRPSVYALLSVLAASLGAGNFASAGEVAIVMSVKVDAYEDAARGFEQSLHGHEIAKIYNMGGDVDRGSDILAKIQSGQKPDLVFAVGIWALQAALNNPTGIPIVYAMVLNPASIVGEHSGNVTGASMNVPVADSLRLLGQLGPQIRRVGVVFSEAKTGYLVDEAREIASQAGIDLVTRSVLTPGEAIHAVDALQQEGIDAFWFLPDETLLSAAVSKHVFLVSHRNRVPILGLSERQAQMGAVLALTFASSEDIGSQAGELANRILSGRSAADVPSTTARRTSLTVNLKAARKLGVDIPESILMAATEVIK
jgi:putative ABC transport system substrate-binding protein